MIWKMGLFTIVVAFMFCQPLKAFDEIGGTLSGSVTDMATGKPIQGASIFLTDVKRGANTNSAGKFAITGIAEGIHLVEVSHVGYSTLPMYVTIKGNTVYDFVLTEAIIENNAVVITGVSKATQLKRMPFQVSVIRKEDLQQVSATNIIDAISKQPGVSALSTGPAISKPFIRGLGYNRVLTINDGVRQEGQQWGDEHGIEIDENSVAKIEVLKGPASLIYGSDAMAGVINIITNTPVPANSLQANVGSAYQTNNRLQNVYANIGANKNGFNWNVYGSTKAAADYKNKFDGRVFNSKFKEQNFGGYGGFNGDWGYSHLIISQFNLQAGLIEGERDSEGRFTKTIAGGAKVIAANNDFKSKRPKIPYQDIKHSKIAIDNNLKIGKDNLGFNLGLQRNERREFGNPDDEKETALYFDLKTFTYNVRYNIREKNGFKPAFGVTGMVQNNVNRGVEQLIPDYALQDAGAFVFLQKDWKKVSISGGARFDTRSLSTKDLLEGTAVKGNAFKKNYSNFSGSAGIAYQASQAVNLKLNIARAFRAPSIPELASNGSHEGTTRYEYGDSKLKVELSTQLDAGIEISNKHFSLNLAGFYNGFSNFIFYKKLATSAGEDSTVLVDGEALSAFTFDQRRAYLTGVEATLDIHPHPFDWLHFANTFSLVAGRFNESIDGVNNLPFIPAPRLITELRGNLKKAGKHFQQGYAKIEVDNTFTKNKVFTAFNTETVTKGYTLLNVGIGTDFINKAGRKTFSIHLAALNITDVAYQNHLSRLKYTEENIATSRMGVFNSGRNFSIKLNIPFHTTL